MKRGPTALGWRIRWFAPHLTQYEYERIAGPFALAFYWLGMVLGAGLGALVTWMVMR
jgi:hypothetical protein